MERDLEELIEYGGFRYHLLLQYNLDEENCVENNLLRRVFDALVREDESALDEASEDFSDLILPFVGSDYAGRTDSREPNASEMVKLRVLSEKGVTRIVSHENYLKYPPTSPVENKYLNIDTYPSTEVETLGSIDHHIFKVEVRHELYCMKSVHRTSHECNFKREIEVLQHCSQPNIIRLVGL